MIRSQKEDGFHVASQRSSLFEHGCSKWVSFSWTCSNANLTLISVQEPIVGNLSRKFNEVQKILEKFITCSHSATSAADEESFPSHLRDVVELCSLLKQEDEVPEITSTPVQRSIQVSALGTHTPTGQDSNAQPRDGT